MVGRIPVYERQVGLSGGQENARGSSNVSGTDPIANATAALGTAAFGAALEYKHQEQQALENIGKVQVPNILSDGQVYWQQKQNETFQAYKVGDPDLREGIAKDFDSWVTENAEKLPTPQSKQYFQAHALDMKTKLLTSAYAYQQKATTEKLNADTAVGQQADENVVALDASQFDSVYSRRMEPLLHRTDLSEAEKIKSAAVYKNKLSFAAERGEVDRDPGSWYEKRFGSFHPGVGGTGSGVSSTLAGPVPDALWSAQINQESGGQQFGKDGKPLTSSAGAIGVAQVMPTTAPEAARLAGVPFSEDKYRNDPAYNEQLGKAYMAEQLRKFDGDPRKALAAYNAGPGRVQKLVSDYGDDWLSHAPAETQDYVKKITARAEKDGRMPVVAVVASVGDVPLEQRPQQPKTFTNIEWEQQLALKQIAETKLRQGEAVFKADAERNVRDAVAMHQDGKVDPFNLSPQYFDRAFGTDGPRAYGEYQKSREMGIDIGKFKTQSASEIQAELNASLPPEGAGYAAADERYNRRVKAAQTVIEQRAKDPAGYVTANTPTLLGLKQTIDTLPPMSADRPALLQRYARESVAEQTRLGIENPAILPKDMADRVVSEFNKATGNGDDMATRINQASKDWGDQWPAVYKQLAVGFKGNLPDSFLTIPGLNSAAARETVARLDHVKLTDLEKQVAAPDVKSIKQGIQEQLKPWSESMLANQQNSDLYQAVMNASTKMALERSARGQGIDAAVKASVGAFIDQYEFTDSHSAQRYAVPKAENVPLVTQGIARVMAAIPQINIGLPPFGDTTGLRKPEEIAKEWKQQVVNNPVWVTNANESGLKLYAEGKDGQRYPVNTPNGQQIEYSFADFRSMVTEMPSYQAPGAPVEKDMRVVVRRQNEERQRQMRAQQAEIDALRGR